MSDDSSRPRRSRGDRPLRRVAPVLAALALAVSALGTSCSSMEFTRESETHGTFYANGVAVTILSIDLPRRAVDIARENLSDARQPNMVIEKEVSFPYLGWFDWILDIFSVRFASVSGTWGFAPPEATGGVAN